MLHIGYMCSNIFCIIYFPYLQNIHLSKLLNIIQNIEVKICQPNIWYSKTIYFYIKRNLHGSFNKLKSFKAEICLPDNLTLKEHMNNLIEYMNYYMINIVLQKY